MNDKVIVVGAGPGYCTPYVGCYSHLEQSLLVVGRPRGKSMLIDLLDKAGYNMQEFVQSQVMYSLMAFDEMTFPILETKRKPKPYYIRSRW